ncbi:MAG: hypothetical protein B6226_01030 [Candidatus Cloacimonetes bacterium 4572_65]|nr:MAG: hypothetical protein B6226_01030 [Candidatus Cloacimonetes bacterium 4572_65]
MKRLLFLAVILASLMLSGCIQYGITVDVNKDGSGEIKEKMELSAQLINILAATSSSDEFETLFEEEKYEGTGSKYGEDVTFKSFKKVENEGKTGFEVVYSFKSIDEVVISEDIFEDTIETLSPKDSEEEVDTKENKIDFDKSYSFKFDKSLLKRKLTINNGFSKTLKKIKKEIESEKDDIGKAIEQVEAIDKDNSQQIAMAKMFLQGMKFYLHINVDGEIKKSNIDTKDNKIVLFEIDMSKLLEEEGLLKKLIQDDSKDIIDILSNDKSNSGIKFQRLEQIEITF